MPYRSIALVLLCAAVAGCDAPVAPKPNVVLVLADTLRADRTSLLGYARPTTPRLDVRARSGVVFEAARSQAPCTFPSVNSLLTSRAPFHFRDQPVDSWTIPPTIPTLAEILGGNGYDTFAVSASSIVRATPSKVNRTGGYGAGFATFDERCEDQDASCVTTRALALARAAHPPYFAYLHYMDPHHPYSPPPGWRNHFAKPRVGLGRFVLRGDPGEILTALYQRHEKRDWPQEIAYLSDSYDDEIRYLDDALNLLLEQLPKSGDDRETIVVIAADHGEDFLEHGDLMHCRSLHETSIHVPLVMWLPGVAGRRVATPVRNLDVVPTVLDYAGVDAAALRLEGRSLRATIDGDAAAPPTHAEIDTRRALVEGSTKLIYDLERGEGRLFDLATDPDEKTDLAASEPERLRALEGRLLERVTATEGGDTRRAARLSRQAQDRLRALGYLE